MLNVFKSISNFSRINGAIATHSLSQLELTILRLLLLESQTSVTLQTWTGNSSTVIYPVLTRLRQLGLVSDAWHRNPDYAPDSLFHHQQVYRTTAAGQQMLERIQTQIVIPRLRVANSSAQ